MKAIIASAGLFLAAIQPSFADDRQVIEIPAEVKGLFLEEMRTHLDNLNEITFAIASGDFKAASFVAKNKMGFGHSMREIMQQRGLPEDQIDEMIEKMRQSHGDVGQGGRGMGRYMPAEVRELGQTFHEAAGKLAQVADQVSNPPSQEDYKNVFTALSEVIDVCSACHSSYRVK